MEEIKNYCRVSNQIATSGQPTQEQFPKIAEAGYQAVINLALPSSTNALVDEGAIVTSLGMAYFHIPVIWEAPRIDDLRLFFGVIEALGDRKFWVHCALNMRVSCFIYLYHKCVLKLPEEQASYPMVKIWQPQEVWQQLIEEAEIVFS